MASQLIDHSEKRENTKLNLRGIPCLFSCCIHFRQFLNKVTVEPAMFLHSLGNGVGGMFQSYMIEDKICLNYFQYKDNVCRNIDSGDFETEEDDVDRMTSLYEVYQRWLVYLPSVCIILFLGVWSDLRGRRFPLLFPLAGSLLTALGFLLNAICWAWPVDLVLISVVPFGITGGMFSLSMAVYSYLSDTTDEETRTARLLVVDMIELIAVPIGKASGTFLYNQCGYAAIFGTQVILYALAITYVLLRLQNHPQESDYQYDSEKNGSDPVQITHVEDIPYKTRNDFRSGGNNDLHSNSLLRSNKLCSLASAKRAFLVALKKRENGGRRFVVAYFAVVSITVFARGGCQLLSLYTSKRFDWDDDDNYAYSISNSFISVFGICVILPLISYYKAVEDALLGFIGSVSSLFHDIIVATAPASWVMYVASAISTCSGMIKVSARGALSKLVAKDELGSLFAVLALGDTFLPLISTPLYTFIFNSSLDSFPGSIFILTAGLAVIVCCILVWILTCEKASDSTKEDAS